MKYFQFGVTSAISLFGNYIHRIHNRIMNALVHISMISMDMISYQYKAFEIFPKDVFDIS